MAAGWNPAVETRTDTSHFFGIPPLSPLSWEEMCVEIWKRWWKWMKKMGHSMRSGSERKRWALNHQQVQFFLENHYLHFNLGCQEFILWYFITSEPFKETLFRVILPVTNQSVYLWMVKNGGSGAFKIFLLCRTWTFKSIVSFGVYLELCMMNAVQTCNDMSLFENCRK